MKQNISRRESTAYVCMYDCNFCCCSSCLTYLNEISRWIPYMEAEIIYNIFDRLCWNFRNWVWPNYHTVVTANNKKQKSLTTFYRRTINVFYNTQQKHSTIQPKSHAHILITIHSFRHDGKGVREGEGDHPLTTFIVLPKMVLTFSFGYDCFSWISCMSDASHTLFALFELHISREIHFHGWNRCCWIFQSNRTEKLIEFDQKFLLLLFHFVKLYHHVSIKVYCLRLCELIDWAQI